MELLIFCWSTRSPKLQGGVTSPLQCWVQCNSCMQKSGLAPFWDVNGLDCWIIDSRIAVISISYNSWIGILSAWSWTTPVIERWQSARCWLVFSWYKGHSGLVVTLSSSVEVLSVLLLCTTLLPSSTKSLSTSEYYCIEAMLYVPSLTWI